MKALAFLKRDFLNASSYKLPFLTQLAGIFVTMVIFFYVSRLVGKGAENILEQYGGDYFSFLLIGVAFTDYLIASVNSFAEEIRRGQLQGTLEALLITPMSIPGILLCSSLFNYAFTTLRLCVYFSFGLLFFGLRLHIVHVSALICIFLLTVISFWGIGMISAALVIIFKQASPVKWLVGPASGLLGGIFYPVDVMPEWLQTLSQCIPVTHAVDAMRHIMIQGAGIKNVFPQVMILSLFAFVLFPFGMWSFKLALTHAKKNGTLLHY